MTGDTPTDPSPIGLPLYRLTESYRFDDDMADILTAFQYREDDIRLRSTQSRPLPVTATSPSTPGLEAIFRPEASLVFLVHDDRRHRMANPIENAIISAFADALPLSGQTPLADGGGATQPLAEGAQTEPAMSPDSAGPDAHRSPDPADSQLSFGVVTPHNAQRGALAVSLPESVDTNTVEKFQGGERDIIAVSATVSDPAFARREADFLLDARRLLVAISRSRLLTIVVCSEALFELVPDPERLDSGPVWGRLFAGTVGNEATPAWAGSLEAFVPGDPPAPSTDVAVYHLPDW